MVNLWSEGKVGTQVWDAEVEEHGGSKCEEHVYLQSEIWAETQVREARGRGQGKRGEGSLLIFSCIPGVILMIIKYIPYYVL